MGSSCQDPFGSHWCIDDAEGEESDWLQCPCEMDGCRF